MSSNVALLICEGSVATRTGPQDPPSHPLPKQSRLQAPQFSVRPQPSWIVIASEPITDVDTTAADMLEALAESLEENGIRIVFAELKDPVRAKIERYQLAELIGPGHFYPTIRAAVDAFRDASGAEWEQSTWEHLG